MTHQRKTDPNLSKEFLIRPLPLIFYYYYADNSVVNYENLKDDIFNTERMVKRKCYRYFIYKFKENGIKSYWMNVSINSTCHNLSSDFIDSIVDIGTISTISERKGIIYDCELNIRITVLFSQHGLNRLKICNNQLHDIINNKHNSHINKLLNEWFTISKSQL
ncbi:hypothetical protein PBI_SCTP2_344 [Salicola phage SCTP-2]|nr:hypothetical protein PBI_SCTP2_344 [Salicola phage SCTP-2]